jgi:hypothetical protein
MLYIADAGRGNKKGKSMTAEETTLMIPPPTSWAVKDLGPICKKKCKANKKTGKSTAAGETSTTPPQTSRLANDLGPVGTKKGKAKKKTGKSTKAGETTSKTPPQTSQAANDLGPVGTKKGKAKKPQKQHTLPAVQQQQELGIGRYSTELYKKTAIAPGKFKLISFVEKKKGTNKQEAENATRAIAKMVVDDFYEHANRGLIIPSKAGFEYNGKFFLVSYGNFI